MSRAETHVKAIVVGDSGVGKTSLLYQYCDNKFLVNQMATVGVDFKVKAHEIDGHALKIQFWDTAGQERFRNITTTYYKGSQGVVLVYSITDRQSFENIGRWLKVIDKCCISQLIQENLPSDVPIILLANKKDLSAQRSVSSEDGYKLACEAQIPFFEVSAKENENLEEAFYLLALQAKLNLIAEPAETQRIRPKYRKSKKVIICFFTLQQNCCN